MNLDKKLGSEEKSVPSLNFEDELLVFRPNRWARLIGSIAFGGMSLLGLSLMLHSIINFKVEMHSWIDISSGAFCFIAFALLFIDYSKTKLIISKDYFKSFGFFRGTRKILISDIIGYRYDPNWGYFLEGDASLKSKPVQVYNYHKNIEPILKYILQAYIDLDEKEANEILEIVDRSGVLGRSKLEIESSKKRLKSIVRFMQGLSVTVVLGFFLFKHIPEIFQLILFLVGCLLPIFALGLAIYFRGAVCLSSVKQSKYVPDIALITLFPMISIYFITLDINLVDTSAVYPYCISIALLIFLLALKAQHFIKPLQRYLNGISLAVFGLFYGYSIVAYSNKAFDASVAKKLTTSVIRKSTTAGKRNAYTAELEAREPLTEGTKIEISKTSYDRLNTGDNATIHLYDGAFGFTWYYLKEIRFSHE